MKKLQNIFSRKKLSYEENAIFFETLSELISTGIPLIKIFDISDMNLKNKDILNMIKSDIQKGYSLSTSLENTTFFSDIALSIVRIGEESGDLMTAFEKLSKYYYKLSETKKSITSALFYPTLLIISIFMLLIFINYYFIPSIVHLYNYDMDSLNFFAKTLFSISLFLNNYKLAGNLLILSVITVIYLFFREIYEERNDNNILQKLPIISKFSKLSAMSNISWAYFIMISSGIDISKSTYIIKNQSKNKAIKEKLALFEKNIAMGKSLKSSVEELNLKDEQLVYFISLGEQSGNLDKYLGILSDMYTKKLNKNIGYISQIIQPVLIVIITFIVGLIISGVVLPALNYDSIL